MDVLEKVKVHHKYIESLGFHAVMTVLIGSQNYGLDNANSDIDTFTFILPSFQELALGDDPKSGEYEVEDGKCMYKDIRLALNLLKKTSPNSVECFLSKYRYDNPLYAGIITKYLDDKTYLNYMIHCNYSHMLYAMAGMARQLTKRNIPAGKRYSHALRLCSMSDKFMSGDLDLLTLFPQDYSKAYKSKRDTSKETEDYYNHMCIVIADLLDKQRNNLHLTSSQCGDEIKGMKLILEFQEELMEYYIKYILKRG